RYRATPDETSAHTALPDPCHPAPRSSQINCFESCNKFSLLMQSRVTSPFFGEPANRVWIEIQNLIQRPSLSDSGVTLFSPYGMWIRNLPDQEDFFVVTSDLALSELPD